MIHENLFLQTNEEIDTSNATPVLLILNSDSITKDLIERLWNKCPIRVCAGKCFFESCCKYISIQQTVLYCSHYGFMLEHRWWG